MSVTLNDGIACKSWDEVQNEIFTQDEIMESEKKAKLTLLEKCEKSIDDAFYELFHSADLYVDRIKCKGIEDIEAAIKLLDDYLERDEIKNHCFKFEINLIINYAKSKLFQRLYDMTRNDDDYAD